MFGYNPFSCVHQIKHCRLFIFKFHHGPWGDGGIKIYDPPSKYAAWPMGGRPQIVGRGGEGKEGKMRRLICSGAFYSSGKLQAPITFSKVHHHNSTK